MASCYKVFPCPHCQKFTYAKIEQKSRVCGVCNAKINVQNITTFEEAQNVAQAHKLAQNKNVGWLAQKGIHLQSEGIKSGESSKKSLPEVDSLSHTKIVKDFVQLVIRMIQSKNISNLSTVADPYLQIFFKSCNPPATITFQEFRRAFLTYIQTQ